ncbi:MAG: hypothetical protein AAFP08_16285, partial [Bacteroidota bacterium]
PFEPSVSRKKSYYLRDLIIRLPISGNKLQQTKIQLRETVARLKETPRFSAIRVAIDVDPY